MNLLTSCKDCVFAIYDGITQTGCEANRLEHFDLEECYDEEKEFYVTKNLSCTMIREKDWLLKGEKIENAVKRAKEEIAFKYVVIMSAESLEEKLNKIYAQSIAPKKIYVYSFSQDRLPPKKNVEYIHFIDSNVSPIERIIKRLKTSINVFYLDNNFDVPANFIQRLEDKIFYSGYRKSILISDTTSSFVFPTILYKLSPTLTYNRIIKEFIENSPDSIGRLEDI